MILVDMAGVSSGRSAWGGGGTGLDMVKLPKISRKKAKRR